MPPYAPSLLRWSFVTVIVAAMMSACSGSDDVMRLGSGSPEPDTRTADAAAGQPVDGSYRTFDGDTVDFASYQGQPLVINFFARSCTACVAEMPDFEAVSQEVAGEVAFVGISTGPRLEDARQLVADTGVTYDLGWDPQGDLIIAFGGYAMPTTVLVDANGVISTVQSRALSRDALRSMIDELLANSGAVGS